METSKLSAEALLKKLQAHPNISARIDFLLSAVDDDGGSLRLADDTEMRLT